MGGVGIRDCLRRCERREVGGVLCGAAVRPCHATVDEQSGSAQDADEQEREQNDRLPFLLVPRRPVTEQRLLHWMNVLDVLVTVNEPPTIWLTIGVRSG